MFGALIVVYVLNKYFLIVPACLPATKQFSMKTEREKREADKKINTYF